MPSFKVAHLNHQGTDLIIVPLESSFGLKSNQDKQSVIADLQLHANAAGLKGTVVPVWAMGARMEFIAPPSWHPYFKSISLAYVQANLNREISW